MLQNTFSEFSPEECNRLQIEKMNLDAKVEMEALKAFSQIDLSQNAINLEEAKNNNFFISGWRPVLGWICSIAFFYSTVAYPLLKVFFPLPQYEFQNLNEVLMAMLGLGGMRTFEKWKNVQNRH